MHIDVSWQCVTHLKVISYFSTHKRLLKTVSCCLMERWYVEVWTISLSCSKSAVSTARARHAKDIECTEEVSLNSFSLDTGGKAHQATSDLTFTLTYVFTSSFGSDVVLSCSLLFFFFFPSTHYFCQKSTAYSKNVGVRGNQIQLTQGEVRGTQTSGNTWNWWGKKEHLFASNDSSSNSRSTAEHQRGLLFSSVHSLLVEERSKTYDE